MMFSVLGFLAPAGADTAENTQMKKWPVRGESCPQWYDPYGGNRVSVAGYRTTVQATAPEGFLISGYCVEVRSKHKGGADPEFYTVHPPQETVTISHSSGKAIAHYTPQYVPADGVQEPQWCSPGFWRNNLDAWNATGYAGNELYSDEFDDAPPRTALGISQNAPQDPTLLQVVQNPQWYGGGATENVADLLSLNHPDVNFVGTRADNCPL